MTPQNCRRLRTCFISIEYKFFCLLETRVKQHKSKRLVDKFGKQWQWCGNSDHSPKGRIWLAWKPAQIRLVVESIFEQVINVLISDLECKMEVGLACVYGLHSIGARKALWKELEMLAGTIVVPWLAMGDFNAIFEVDHREGGNEVAFQEMVDERTFLDDYHVGCLKTVGHYYSWLNKDHNGGGIRSRIDHCLEIVTGLGNSLIV